MTGHIALALLAAFGLVDLVYSQSGDPNCCANGIRVLGHQPYEIIRDGTTSTTTQTRTYTVFDPTITCPPSRPGGTIVTTEVPGPPGTETILPPPGCTSDCTTIIRVSTPPAEFPATTLTVPGSVPGTATLTPTCTEVTCVPTVRITTVPTPGEEFPPITVTVPGPTAGTETISPTCTEATCVPIIRITSVPTPGQEFPPTTLTVTGPTPGTETIEPTCTEATCVPIVRITTTPTPGQSFPPTTIIVTGTVPGTETVLPTCTEATCVPIIRITTTPSAIPTPTPEPEPEPTPPINACYFPPAGSCSTTGAGAAINLELYANSVEVDEGYAISDGVSGVGPDYYLDLVPLDTGSTTRLDVDIDPVLPPPGERIWMPSEDSVPRFSYVIGDTKTHGGMTFDSNNYTMVYKGYYVPEASGTHTFCTFADNRNPIYVGSDVAFPCGDSSNEATPRGAEPLAEHWLFRDEDTVCNDIEMEAGFHYPIRMVFGNWGIESLLETTVQGPNDAAPVSDVVGRVAAGDCA